MLARQGRVGVERAVHEELAEQEPRAQVLRDQPRVLADPAQPSALGPATLQDRAGVGVPERARSRQELADETLELAQLVAHDAVVVLARGIAGNASDPLVKVRIAIGVVTEGHAHHGPQIAKDGLGAGAAAPVLLRGEVGHLAMAAGGEPGLVVEAGLEGTDGGDAHRAEP